MLVGVLNWLSRHHIIAHATHDLLWGSRKDTDVIFSGVALGFDLATKKTLTRTHQLKLMFDVLLIPLARMVSWQSVSG